MSMSEAAGIPLFTLGAGAVIGGLAATGYPVTAGIFGLSAMAIGLGFMVNSRRDKWNAELDEFRRRYLAPFCDELDRGDHRWRLYDYRGSGDKLEVVGAQIASKFYQPATFGGTFADRCLLGPDAYDSLETARAGLVDICEKWGTRWRLGGFGKFLDKRWEEYGQVLVMLGYVERVKSDANLLPDRLSETGLGRVLARYYETSLVRKVAAGPLGAEFLPRPAHGP